MTHRKPIDTETMIVHRHVYLGTLFVIEDSLLRDLQAGRMTRLRPLLEEWLKIKAKNVATAKPAR